MNKFKSGLLAAGAIGAMVVGASGNANAAAYAVSSVNITDFSVWGFRRS